MIGLKRHTVQVIEHNDQWSRLGIDCCESILKNLGDRIVDVQHVGSTAVPDLPAKPILDIAIAIQSKDIIPIITKRLTKMGYIDRGDGGDNGGYLLVKESKPNIRTIHIHIVESADSQWKEYIVFRDTLRLNSSVKKKYADLKKELMKKFPNDRRSYTNAKHHFIRSILGKSE